MIHFNRAALAASVLCLCLSAPASAAVPLTLDNAFDRVIESHPDLAAYRFAEAAYQAEAEQARQTPPLRLEAEAENILGTGPAAGFGGAEFGVSLASVIERGGKRGARFAVADQRLRGLQLLREGDRLDLLAEVARRYLDAIAATALAALTRDDLAQRDQWVAITAERRRAGVESSSAMLAAEASRSRVAAELDRNLSAATHARRRLAVLWGDASTDFELATVDLAVLPRLPDYQALVSLLAETPALQQFAHRERLNEARLQLARSARVADIDWRVGVRRLQSESDWGLVGSVSIPLGSATRAAPRIRAAEAELAAIEVEREGRQRSLQATLTEAWAQLELAIGHARLTDTEVLPALRRAAEEAERSYRAGASSYLEWTQLQGEIVAARREHLEAALTAHRALIELQRLTGQTFTVAAGTDKGITP
ncbi:TolC family protein [Wenzhouxiangella marina]|uniref:Cation transporter n=1 Tax=Wenzhouxiangella marina TaxID=1579979 RepID=A0A0K0XY42_9GAMM|nr:TolC family protein [Wenzhouxiangella marina]AKS42541.1 cation transporter [Wenzhouxiangella marina]MBB6085681.1 cobalt-zinc-cadmium efflux system outer membrane protein [Wenzhouxiangella marina]